MFADGERKNRLALAHRAGIAPDVGFERLLFFCQLLLEMANALVKPATTQSTRLVLTLSIIMPPFVFILAYVYDSEVFQSEETMPYPIEQKLVIAVASSALFDLKESDRVFRQEGEQAYRQYQEAHLQKLEDQALADDPDYRRILNVLKPHMFFDDQRSHLESDAGDVPMVHIPFGVSNTAGVE